jgi:type IV pilus assembly protein PilM
VASESVWVLWKKKVQLGVDLGTFHVKICALEGSQAACHVWSGELMPQRQTHDANLEQNEALSSLKELLTIAEKRSPYWSKKASVSTTDQGLTAAYLELPKLEPRQLKVAIPSAVAREIPQGLKDVEISHLVVPALHPEKTGVFYLAMPKAAGLQRVGLLSHLGYEVTRHEPGLLALIRGLARNGSVADGESVVVVDCGFRQTTVLWMNGGHPYFAREFRMAGVDFTYAIQMAEQCDWANAEQLKRSYDLREDHFELEPFVLRWMEELKRSIAFASRKLGGLQPQRLLLTGGTSLWTGLPERVEAALNIPVTRHSWKQMKPADKNAADQHSIVLYDTALGLVSG